MNHKALILAMALPSCLPAAACASTQHALEVAQAKVDEAKAIAAKAEAQRQQVCGEALEAAQIAKVLVPLACMSAPAEATAVCAQQDKHDAAIKNLTLACELK